MIEISDLMSNYFFFFFRFIQNALQHIQNCNRITFGVFKKDWLILIADLDLRQTRSKLVIWKPYATD